MTKTHHILAALLVLGVVLAVGVTPAMAEHKFEHPFGSGRFSAIAVDQETGNVYVDNKKEPEAIDVFGADGGPPAGGVPTEITSQGLYDINALGQSIKRLRTGAVAVDNACEQQKPALTGEACAKFDPSNDDVYVPIELESGAGGIARLALNVSDQYEAVAVIASPVETPAEGVAVDDQGDVYLTSEDVNGNDPYLPIVEFNAEGKELVQIKQYTIRALHDVAVGAPGIVYAGRPGEGIVKLTVGSGGQVLSEHEQMLDPQGGAVAVDPRTGIVYGDNVSSISEYNSAGVYLTSFGAGVISESAGIAVNAETGRVYESNGGANGSYQVTNPVDAFEEVFVPGAKISEEQATDINQTAATLQVQIDPNKSPVLSCVFEYGTSGEYGQHVSCAPASLATGEVPVPVSARVEGLQSSTSYYYRVVVGSELETSPGSGTSETKEFYGPNEILTTPALPSSAPETCSNASLRAEQPFGLTLPDCRAYELVSPLEKNDNGIQAYGGRAAVSGDALTYLSEGAFSEPRANLLENRYLARRGTDGWSTQDISPPVIPYGTITTAPFEELFFTPELSKGVVLSESTPLVEGEPAGYSNLDVADLQDGSYQAATPVTPPGVEPYTQIRGSETPEAGGVSTDLSHIVFQQEASLTTGASSGLEHVYEWAGGKMLSQVDLPPEGVKFNKGDDTIGAPGFRDRTSPGDTWHAVSANGSRVFFTASEGKTKQPVEKEEGQLYVRENPTGSSEEECAGPATACTVEVSKSQRKHADPHGPQPAYFRDASSNGERVFFTSRAELTENAYTDEDKAANLYECQLIEVEEEPACKLTDLTVDDEETTDGAAVLGLVNASEDGSYVYFVANGVLATGENANKEQAQAGNCSVEEGKSEPGEPTCSLYLAHYNGAAWEAPKFVATLSAGDLEDWIGYEGGDLSKDSGPGSHTARVTADGTTLAFESERSLTGYDNQRAEPGECETQSAGETGKCREVYLYDATTGRIACASCDPSGARPVGPAQLGGHQAESVNGILSFYLPRNLSEDGRRVFFQTPDALAPSDTNKKLDVYEWEAAGEGSCTEASTTYVRSSGGCILQISDVSGDYESKFMDASPSGDDVFINTADQLVPADTDTRADVYDVRVGGGFPVVSAPARCTNADACKPPESPQPSVFAPPASATFSGPANPVGVGGGGGGKPATKPLTRAQKLTAALKVCKRDKKKSTRQKCEKQAKNKYAVAKKSAHINRRAK